MSDRAESVPLYLPIDLGLVALIGIWMISTSATGVGDESIPRILLGAVGVVFAPGYALAAVLFPESGSLARRFEEGSRWTPDDDRGATVTAVERLLLSVGLSVCVVPLIGFALNFLPGPIRPAYLVSSIGATTLLLVAIAAVRRWQVPPPDRFAPMSAGSIRDAMGRLGSRGTESWLSVLLVAGLLIAGSGIGFAVAGTERGEQFTEFYVASEDPETGELVAGRYPAEIPRGETRRVQVGITNQEGETMDYTVLVLLQSFEAGDVNEVQRLDVFSMTVEDGETRQEPHTIRPGLTGENLRVTYLLYDGPPPGSTSPDTETAYRHVHVWIDVPSSGPE